MLPPEFFTPEEEEKIAEMPADERAKRTVSGAVTGLGAAASAAVAVTAIGVAAPLIVPIGVAAYLIGYRDGFKEPKKALGGLIDLLKAK